MRGPVPRVKEDRLGPGEAFHPVGSAPGRRPSPRRSRPGPPPDSRWRCCAGSPITLCVRFRSFDPEDLDLLERWLRASDLPAPAALDRDGDTWAVRVMEDPRIHIEVAVDEDGEPAGFLRLDHAPDRSAEVTVLVDPGRRRRGVGQALVLRALERGRELELNRLVAMISESNDAGLALFFGLGFEDNGSVPGHRRLDRLIHRTRHAEPLEIIP